MPRDADGAGVAAGAGLRSQPEAARLSGATAQASNAATTSVVLARRRFDMGVTLAPVSGNVHEALVVDRHKLTDEIERFTLRVDARAEEPREVLSFRTGQFVSLRVGEDADGSAVLRSYSIASSPGGDSLQLVVRHIPGGMASAWFDRLTLGTRVRFTGPMGFFVLELQHPGDIVFGVTGVGIAPVLPMIDEALSRNETGKIHLLWGNRHARDLFWQDEWAARVAAHPRLSVRVFVTRDPPPAGCLSGRITEPLLELVPELVKPTFYLVGSGAMIDDVKRGLVERGIERKRQIRTEAFFD
jgi:ferredoxin-NADP reductase